MDCFRSPTATRSGRGPPSGPGAQRTSKIDCCTGFTSWYSSTSRACEPSAQLRPQRAVAAEERAGPQEEVVEVDGAGARRFRAAYRRFASPTSAASSSALRHGQQVGRLEPERRRPPPQRLRTPSAAASAARPGPCARTASPTALEPVKDLDVERPLASPGRRASRARPTASACAPPASRPASTTARGRGAEEPAPGLLRRGGIACGHLSGPSSPRVARCPHQPGDPARPARPSPPRERRHARASGRPGRGRRPRLPRRAQEPGEGALLVHHLELRVEPGLGRVVSQELPAEAVDGPGRQAVQPVQPSQPGLPLRRRACLAGRPRPLGHRRAHPGAELLAGLLGEGDGGELARRARRPVARPSRSRTTSSTSAVVFPEPAPAETAVGPVEPEERLRGGAEDHRGSGGLLGGARREPLEPAHGAVGAPLAAQRGDREPSGAHLATRPTTAAANVPAPPPPAASAGKASDASRGSPGSRHQRREPLRHPEQRERRLELAAGLPGSSRAAAMR